MWCFTALLDRQGWPLAILGESSIQMMLVSKTITCHDSNRVILIKSRWIYTIEAQLHCWRLWVGVHRMKAIDSAMTRLVPLPFKRVCWHEKITKANNTPHFPNHFTTEQFLAPLYIELAGRTNGASKSTRTKWLSAPAAQKVGRNE